MKLKTTLYDQKLRKQTNKQLFTNTFTTATSPSEWPGFFHRLPTSSAVHHKKSTQRTCSMPGNSTQHTCLMPDNSTQHTCLMPDNSMQYVVLDARRQHTICRALYQAAARSMLRWPTQNEHTSYLLNTRQQHAVCCAGHHKKSTQRTCSMPGWSMLYSGLRSTCSLMMGKQLRTCKARRSSGGPISSVGIMSFSETPARERESAVPGRPVSLVSKWAQI